MKKEILKEHFVYFLSLGLLSVLVLLGIIIPEPFQRLTEFLRDKITVNFG